MGHLVGRTNQMAWEIVPQNTLAGIILGILFIYLFVRHFIFIMMVFDIIIGWLRQFRWFPGKGKRLRAVIHWGIALGLFGGFLAVSGWAGWVKFIPK